MIAEIKRQLKQLRLSGIAEVLSIRNQEAISSDLAHLEFLQLLLQDESNIRAERRIKRNTKKAKFRELKTLEQFDFTFNKSINKKQIFDLATSQYLRTFDNILFLGPAGTGKSHLAQALGICAIQTGYTVIYRSAFDLATEMSEANIHSIRKETINIFVKPDLLIIDDFGLKTLPATAAEDFLEIVMRRYEVNSTILTSNRPVEDFAKVLKDTTAVMAILDRFLHHAHIIKIKGKSYRMQNRKKYND